jgi:hypothetical protein
MALSYLFGKISEQGTQADGGKLAEALRGKVLGRRRLVWSFGGTGSLDVTEQRKKNMKKKLLVGLAIGVLVARVGSAEANIIDSTYGAGAGSFELGNFVNGGGNPNAAGSGYMGLLPDDTTITGWTVGGPGDGVDWLLASYYGADTGIHSVDLQHLSASSIFTSIPTIAGNEYELLFSTATYLGYSTTGAVSAGSVVNQVFSATPSSTHPQAFTPYSFMFTATGPTTLIQFMSTGPNTAYGPAIDSVSVEPTAPVPVPATMLLFGTGIAGLVGTRLKRKKQ